MNLVKRLAKLEKTFAPARVYRVVTRVTGPGSEKYPQPTQEEIDRASGVVTIRLVAAKDGRPA